MLVLLALLLPLTVTAAPHDDFAIYIPYITQPAAKIGGYVTEGGAPAANASIQLWRLTLPSSYTLLITTSTNSEGRYDFVSHPLPPGQVYWLQFVGSSPSRLLWWSARPYVDTNSMGLNVTLPTFDVAGITQTAPGFNALVSLPAVFKWTVRPATPQDRYRLSFSGSYAFQSPQLGYTGSYNLGSLPAGAPAGHTQGYNWLVQVSWPSGAHGVQSGDSRVYFNNAGLAGAGWLVPGATSEH